MLFRSYNTTTGGIGEVISVHTFASESKSTRVFASSDMFSNLLGSLDSVAVSMKIPEPCTAIVMKCEQDWLEPLFVMFS